MTDLEKSGIKTSSTDHTGKEEKSLGSSRLTTLSGAKSDIRDASITEKPLFVSMDEGVHSIMTNSKQGSAGSKHLSHPALPSVGKRY